MKSYIAKCNVYVSSGETGTELKTYAGVDWRTTEAIIRTDILKGHLVTIEMAEPEEE